MFYNYTTRSIEHEYESDEWDFLAYNPSENITTIYPRYKVLEADDSRVVVGFISDTKQEMFSILNRKRCKFMSEARNPIYDFTEIWEHHNDCG